MRLTPPMWASGIAVAALLLGLGILVINEFSPPQSAPGRILPARHRPIAARRPAAKKVVPPPISAFILEEQMTPGQLLRRWDGPIADGSKRLHLPEPGILAVIVAGSGGLTMSAENRPIVSSAGAMGLMQLTPDTYQDMRVAYGLGADPQ